jgi:hypothetical protein
MFIKIFSDSLISSMVLIIAVIIFEIIFFFVKIQKDIKKYSLKMIDKIQVNDNILEKFKNNVSMNNLFSQIPQLNNLEHMIKIRFSQSIRDLVEINKKKLNNKRKKALTILYLCLFIYIIITLILAIILRKHIDFYKLIVFVSLTLIITAIFELVFYFKIFSKIKTTNMESLIIKLHEKLIDYLKK